jgi:type VI secretion system protein ImpE
MTALELLSEGRLAEAVREQDRLVALRPNDAAARLLLAELLLFDGDLDAVRKHLDAISTDSATMAGYLDACRLLIDAEAKRQRLLIDVQPQFLLMPPEHLSWRLDALENLRGGRQKEAMHNLDEADARAPWLTGHVDGRAFDGVRDGDDLFGPLLEVLIDGEYVWFPFEQISRLRLDGDEGLRAAVFVPAVLRAVSGDEWHVHLPALYPGTHRDPDEEVRIGQATDWIAEDDGPTRGVGLRVLSFGAEEMTLLDFIQWEG